MIQLLGQDFGCNITLDTTEEERIRITDKTIKEEISATDASLLALRPSVVAFMGHVDHGKTSLIDAIRSSNRASGEAGAITQHIGAFRCSTAVGDITILDTPGHEAFSSMRARGADVTDIVVLVVAGDEGIRQQTIEAINHAKAAGVTIVVAINKADKPNFDADTVYRQLSEQELLPEAWGGQTITINCSAVTKQGIKELLEMLALQAEILELRANPKERARGTVIESEMHKGMGAVATVLVQNGTLRVGDAIVFSKDFGKIKTMKDENGKLLMEAGPATPVMITGLSGLPDAGQEFIVVKSEKEAKEIAAARSHDFKQTNLLQKKKISMDSLMQNASTAGKKILNLILRADVQGSLEALKVAIMKIESDKAEPNIIFAGVGEISESDVQLAAVSKAVIFGFHTQIEGHAESIIKEHGVQTRLHDIIYHAVDDVKLLLTGLLDKISQETEKGKAVVKAVFSSSHYGQIAGCQVSEGSIARNNQLRIVRGKDTIWKGTMASLKRVKEDVREVQKGHECGIVLNNFNDVKEGDVIEAYEITYLTQSL
jgi:translation initiation factor IF-2